MYSSLLDIIISPEHRRIRPRVQIDEPVKLPDDNSVIDSVAQPLNGSNTVVDSLNDSGNSIIDTIQQVGDQLADTLSQGSSMLMDSGTGGSSSTLMTVGIAVVALISCLSLAVFYRRRTATPV